MEIVVTILATLLLVSLVSNYLLIRARNQAIAQGMVRETRLLDRVHAAELRAAEQIDAMLDRINTSPRIEVRPRVAKIDPDELTHITDADDVTWNKYVGEPPEDASDQATLEELRERMFAQGDAR